MKRSNLSSTPIGGDCGTLEVMMWFTMLTPVAVSFAVLLALAFASSFAGVTILGAFRWRAETRDLLARMEAARMPVQPQRVHFQEIEGLPAPVQRYFRKVLTDGQPLVAGVQVDHRGTFNMGQGKDAWKPFTSAQQVITQRPGFDWNAQIMMAPGLRVRVHDAYVTGEGVLHAALFGLMSWVYVRGADDVARGELMRFLAEAAWYPTALLPSQGVRWEALGDRTAAGTLTDGSPSLTLQFTFNEQDFIESVRVDDRGRMVEGTLVPTPWQGRFWNYEKRDDMLVPLDGEVAWLLPEGEHPYWRGHITTITYEYSHSK